MEGHHEAPPRAGGLILTRQALPTLDRTKYARAAGLPKGPTSWPTPDGKPEVLLLATGSEVALCVEAYEQLKAEGIERGSLACHRGRCSTTSRRITATACCRPQ